MIRLKYALAVGVALMSVAGVAHSQRGMNDLEIAHSAYTADVIDIEYAQIALGKTKNAEVRRFAELMIRDHTAVNEGATALLAKLKVAPQDNPFSQALTAGAEKKKAELKGLDGVAFDRAYAANELAYHQVVNKTVADWIPTIRNDELKTFLTQALVTFRAHEAHAAQMVAALK